MAEIVITVGLPGCGKSTLVQDLVSQGYCRLNRDEIGGSLSSPEASIYYALRQRYHGGARKFVLDNTFTRLEHRQALMQAARDLGLPVRVLWLQTTLEQAQLFAARRQVQRYGKILRAEEYDWPAYSIDPNMFRPGVQYAFAKALVEPTMAEGFEAIEQVPVETKWGPQYINRAILLDLDGTVRTTPDEKACPWPRDPQEVILLDGRRDLLLRKQQEGFRLLGVTNQSGCSRKPSDEKYVSEEMVQKCIDRTNELLDLPTPIEVLYATDRGGPPQSFWRKPMPGMGVVFIEKYKLNPAACVCVGDMKTDKTFADRCGFPFSWAHEFFRT